MQILQEQHNPSGQYNANPRLPTLALPPAWQSHPSAPRIIKMINQGGVVLGWAERVQGLPDLATHGGEAKTIGEPLAIDFTAQHA
jgi:hypothetical protein